MHWLLSFLFFSFCQRIFSIQIELNKSLATVENEKEMASTTEWKCYKETDTDLKEMNETKCKIHLKLKMEENWPRLGKLRSTPV